MEKQNKKNGTFGRLLRYIYKNYRVYMITVIICIIIAAAASVVQTVFLQRLIDTCILPGLENGASGSRSCRRSSQWSPCMCSVSRLPSPTPTSWRP